MLSHQYRFVVDYCAKEVQRQEATPLHVSHMFQAWYYLHQHAECHKLITEDVIRITAAYVMRDDLMKYRQTPVSFSDMSLGLSAELIPRQMMLLVEAQEGVPHVVSVDEWVKQFLDIHPFEDGNGRTASLLWNFFNGTMDDPRPMPIYYGEGV
jgi:hypothetical protein